MAPKPLNLYHLPNEILVSLLTPFQTHDLLPLTLVSHHFHNVVLRILHFRLLVAAEAPDYKIILETYLPARQYTRPYLYCTYLGTDGLSSTIEGEGSIYRDLEGKVGGRLSRLSGLYSRFRPEYPVQAGQMPARRIAGAAPNLASNTAATDWLQTNQPGFDARPPTLPTLQPTAAAAADQPAPPLQTQPIFGNTGDGGRRKVIYTINLDAHESFSQICCAATLVELTSTRGVFRNTARILEDRQGVIRMWREWLIGRAEMLVKAGLTTTTTGKPELHKTSTNSSSTDIFYDKNILWTNYQRNFGLRFAVREKVEDPGVDTQRSNDSKEDIALDFDVEILEFVIRTTNLMLSVEELQQTQKTPGKALIFGSWAVAAES